MKTAVFGLLLTFIAGCTNVVSTPDAVYGLIKLGPNNYHPVTQFKSMAECVAAAQKAYHSPEGNTADTASIVVACGAVYDQPR
jgi:hypothetical protein